MSNCKQGIILVFIATSLFFIQASGYASEVAQDAISTTNPAGLIPSAAYDATTDTLVNGLSPTNSYNEYATSGSPFRYPVPFVDSFKQCEGGNGLKCHYPTNRWFTDLLFYAKSMDNGKEVGDKFSVAESPYNVSVVDAATETLHSQTGKLLYNTLPGLYVAYNT